MRATTRHDRSCYVMFCYLSRSLSLTRPLHEHTAAQDPPPPRPKFPPALLAGQNEEEKKEENVVLDPEETPVATTGRRVEDEPTSSVAAAASAEETVPQQQLPKEAVDGHDKHEKTAQTRYLELPNYSEEGPIVVPPDGSIIPREFVPFHGKLIDPHSILITLESYLPLDVAFTENEEDGILLAAIVFDYGHGYRAGIRWKDRLRAVSATKLAPPTSMVGRAGDATDAVAQQQTTTTTTTTKTIQRFLYSCDGKHLEDVLAAIESNALDPDRRPILIIVERSLEKENDNDGFDK
jgi:hypothetical protein